MLKRLLTVTILLAGTTLAAHADAVSDAMADVQKYAGQKTTWDGPTSGPKAAEGKTIVVLAADMK
ncbi:MAG: sugar ABC transporter substrate-binding protein, partial [Pannonibacter indicus]